MGMNLFHVDAFTDRPFAGNPAAVCVLSHPGEDRWMQQVAKEMNLPETAFLHPEGDGYRLRSFTPSVEVDLGGHDILASAHVLWETGRLQTGENVRFYTHSGLLIAERKDRWIEMDFPATREEEISSPLELAMALGITPRYVGKSRFDYLVEVDSEETVRELMPDFKLLRTIPIRGVMVTSASSSPAYDFVSRFFAPRFGIDEDSVTGSSHCCLGPFWSRRLGKNQLVAYQASARGGVLRVRVSGERVYLGGQAVTVLRGELLRP